MLDERQAKLQRHRLRMTSLTVFNTVLQTVVMAAYALSGVVSWPLVGAFAAVSLGSTLAFTGAVALHWNLRFPEPWLLLAQLGCQVLIMLAFLALAPQVAPLFLVSLLVTFNFAMMSFSPRQFTVAWILFALTTGAALLLGHERFATVPATAWHMAVLWLVFVFAVRRLSVIGTQFSLLRHQLSRKNELLQASLERIQELATHDELTGAFNRRRFLEMLAEERQRTSRTGETFCVALLDLDHFKDVNDRHGHLVGDHVLRRFCQVAQEALRATDRFARYGGEEFVVLMPATTTPAQGALAVERIRAAVAAADWGAEMGGDRITASAGVAAWRPDEGIEPLLSRADAALYDAKRAGRDRVVLAD